MVDGIHRRDARDGSADMERVDAARRRRRTAASFTLADCTLWRVGCFRDVAITRDATHVVYVGNDGTQISVRALDQIEPTRLPLLPRL